MSSPMGGGGRDDRRKSKRYRRRRPALMIVLIQNCSPICITNLTNPSVIVEPLEFDIGRPDRFAWDAASGTRAVSVEAHRSACDSRGAHRLLFVVVFIWELCLTLESAPAGGSHCTFHSCEGRCRMDGAQLYKPVLPEPQLNAKPTAFDIDIRFFSED